MKLRSTLKEITAEQRELFHEYAWLAKVETRRKMRWVESGGRDGGSELRDEMYSAALHGLLQATTLYREPCAFPFKAVARKQIRYAMINRYWENEAGTTYAHYAKGRPKTTTWTGLNLDERDELERMAGPGRDGFEAVDDRDEVEAMLATLRPRQRKMLAGYYLEGRLPAEIAVDLGISREPAYRLLHTACADARWWAMGRVS